MDDGEYMRRAVRLAERGSGRVNPNPLVGAVIVKNGVVVGEGWHARFGGLHAERAALARCREVPRGGALYVTLEPCCHQGKTPPCTEAILESGISRVVVGSDDPNPLVSGRGLEALRSRGVEVVTGVLKSRCDALNRPFFHFIRHRTPYVVLKYAMTMDGKTGTRTGASRWITGEAARRRVHRDRNRYAAVMVGVGTVLTDDPSLTCRLKGGRDPLRVVCDTHLRTPLSAQVVTTAGRIRTVLATAVTDERLQRPFLEAGCELLSLPIRDGLIDLSVLMRSLGAMDIDSVLVEGGGALGWSLLRSGLVHRVQAYVAPLAFGGRSAPSPVGGTGVTEPRDGFRFAPPTVTRLGDDLLLESEVLTCSQDS